MAGPTDISLDFEESVLGASEDRDEGERLTVSLDGYEGPLDLLLDLARRNKLDLREISILDLADQYLAYIQEARRLKLEVAGDYLVMGAWLAYLNRASSCRRRQTKPTRRRSISQAASRIACNGWKHPEAWRNARRAPRRCAGKPAARGRGGVIVERQFSWEASLQDLISAYAELRKVHAQSRYRIGRAHSVPIPEARSFVEGELARERDWATLDSLLAAWPPAAQPHGARGPRPSRPASNSCVTAGRM